MIIRNSKKRYRPQLGYSMTKAVLDILLGIGESISIFDTPYIKMKKSFRKLRGVPEPESWRLNRALRYLEYRGELKIRKEGDELFVKLTKKGKLKALLSKMEHDFKQKNPWDGKWRIMIWDIPESSRRHRDMIRAFVKDKGFYQVQKSVFVTPYELPASAINYLKESGLNRFIRFMRVDKMDDDQSLIQHFKLKNIKNTH